MSPRRRGTRAAAQEAGGAGPAPEAAPRPPQAPSHAGRPEPEPPAARIDALGRKCPLPIIMLAGQIGSVPVGGLIQVLADDPAARTDVPAWCGLKAHQLVAVTELAPRPGWAFLVRRCY